MIVGKSGFQAAKFQPLSNPIFEVETAASVVAAGYKDLAPRRQFRLVYVPEDIGEAVCRAEQLQLVFLGEGCGIPAAMSASLKCLPPGSRGVRVFGDVNQQS